MLCYYIRCFFTSIFFHFTSVEKQWVKFKNDKIVINYRDHDKSVDGAILLWDAESYMLRGVCP